MFAHFLHISAHFWQRSSSCFSHSSAHRSHISAQSEHIFSATFELRAIKRMQSWQTSAQSIQRRKHFSLSDPRQQSTHSSQALKQAKHASIQFWRSLLVMVFSFLSVQISSYFQQIKRMLIFFLLHSNCLMKQSKPLIQVQSQDVSEIHRSHFSFFRRGHIFQIEATRSMAIPV